MDRNPSSILWELPLPVLICANREELPVLYGNAQAGLLFSVSSKDPMGESIGYTLKQLLEPEGEEVSRLYRQLVRTGQITDRPVRVGGSNREAVQMALTLKTMKNGEILAYMLPRAEESGVGFALINSMHLNEGAEKAISSVLEVAGTQAGVSRADIFEELSQTSIRNTYEWCAPGVAPMIQELQNEDKRSYNNNDLAVSGQYVLEDVRTLPAEDREIFERQGIRAVMIFNVYEGREPIGYVGFDDCNSCRTWKDEEIRFLGTIASLVSNLLSRRNSEKKTRLTQEILQLMSDHSDDFVYVRDLEDHTVKFVSKAACDMLGKSLEDLIGKPCFEVIRLTKKETCDHCPIEKINWKPGQARSDIYTWEYYSDLLEKHLLIKSSIITWVDGRPAYMARATDITEQVDAQKKLRFYNSMDMLLGIYNRRWGEQLLRKKVLEPDTKGSLCFVDVDGLKRVNDTLGHHAGDQLLMETVALIQAYLPGDEIFCRWGGDEFLIWAPWPVEEIQALFEKMKLATDRLNSEGGRTFPLSFSYGIIPFESGEEASLDAMITVADGKMYEQKIKKRNERFG